MITDVPLPLGGFSEGFQPDKQPTATSGYMNNCRPRDVLEKKIRIGQRPGLAKAYSQQIGGAASPIVWLGSITIVD
jgi:hypothetical protein